MIIGTFIFLLAFVVLMQPIITIVGALTPIINTSSSTMMYGTDTNGAVVAVGYANAAGDLVPFLFNAIGFFMIIGFVIWLVMRAPNEPDFGNPYEQQGGNF
jgi:hypothetical protein